MKVALILPFDALDLVSQYDTGYHLILPHLYWGNETYNRVYREIGGFKILDNGAAEGVEVYHVDLHDVATSCSADEIVVPDTLGDCDDTIRKVRAFERWARPDQFQYAGVVQGRTMAEIVKCLNFYDGEEWITSVHIPRIVNRTIHRTFRFTFLEALFGQTGSKYQYRFDNIHCLGASEWIREAAALASVPIIRGMDTSLLASMAIAQRSIGTSDAEYAQRQPNFFETPIRRESTTWKLLCGNIERYLDWAGCDYTGEEASGGQV